MTFQVDIHPAAKIGRGIMLATIATGIVVGETAVIEDGRVDPESVTLGGYRQNQRRSPSEIREGVMIARVPKSSAISKWPRREIGAGSVVCCSPCRRTPPPLRTGRASSVSQTVINRPWIWISTSTAFTIR
ncbi:hypothetical protein [Enterobacter bugandensis]|uniref:hypothetical protein n=1 Tax=Enterobacter bugandensis TaxID=881260 RepID=UPI00358DBA03